MTYGWHNEAELLMTHHWMEYATFMAVLRSFKFKAYSVKANRDIMRTHLDNMQPAHPFSINDRFPDDAIYIDLTHSVPSRLLNQLAKSLDYADRQTEKGRAVPDGVEVRTFSNMEDSKVAFYESLEALLDLVGTKRIETCHVVGIYVRGTFEQVYNLIWS